MMSLEDLLQGFANGMEQYVESLKKQEDVQTTDEGRH